MRVPVVQALNFIKVYFVILNFSTFYIILTVTIITFDFIINVLKITQINVYYTNTMIRNALIRFKAKISLGFYLEVLITVIL